MVHRYEVPGQPGAGLEQDKEQDKEIGVEL